MQIQCVCEFNEKGEIVAMCGAHWRHAKLYAEFQLAQIAQEALRAFNSTEAEGRAVLNEALRSKT